MLTPVKPRHKLLVSSKPLESDNGTIDPDLANSKLCINKGGAIQLFLLQLVMASHPSGAVKVSPLSQSK